MKSMVLLIWLGLVSVALAAYGGFYVWRAHQQTQSVAADKSPEVPTPFTYPAGGEPLKPFTLTDSQGREFESTQLRGTVWVGSFFFTTCTGPCYRMNQELANQRREWPGEVRYVSITCNPDIDTCEQLSRYASRFDADPKRWVFLRGEMEDLEAVGKDVFQLAVKKEMHSERVVVVDRRGAVRGRYNLAFPEHLQVFRKLVSQLLKEPVPPPAADEKPATAVDPPAAVESKQSSASAEQKAGKEASGVDAQ